MEGVTEHPPGEASKRSSGASGQSLLFHRSFPLRLSRERLRIGSRGMERRYLGEHGWAAVSGLPPGRLPPNALDNYPIATHGGVRRATRTTGIPVRATGIPVDTTRARRYNGVPADTMECGYRAVMGNKVGVEVSQTVTNLQGRSSCLSFLADRSWPEPQPAAWRFWGGRAIPGHIPIPPP